MLIWLVIFASDCAVNQKSNVYPDKINNDVQMCNMNIRSQRFYSVVKEVEAEEKRRSGDVS